MTKRIRFGQTWWGRQWLSALTDLDYENRLSRGRDYYRSGKIDSLVFNADKVEAEAVVSGNGYYPYEVHISMNPLSEEEVSGLVDAISVRSDLVAKLLDGELDPEIAEVAAGLGIDLFPKSWRQFRMSCTCPDSAVPCKHLAAVYYSIVNSIDLDPMWVFRLIGVNLTEELKARHMDISDAVRLEDPSWREWRSLNENLGEVAPCPLERLPFYTIEELSGKLCQLLPVSGSAGKSELKRKRAQKHFDLMKKWASECLTTSELGLSSWESWENTLPVGPVVPVLVWKEGIPEFIVRTLEEKQEHRLSVRQRQSMLKALAETSIEEARSHSQVLAFWSILSRAVLSMMVKGAMVPLLHSYSKNGENVFSVAWTPAVQDSAVSLLLRMAAASGMEIPEDAVIEEGEPCEESPYGTVYSLFGAMMTAYTAASEPLYAPAYYSKLWGLLTNPSKFLRYGIDIADINELRKWLSPLSLAQRSLVWSPVLTVRGAKNAEVSLNLGVVPRGAGAKTKPMLLAKALDDPLYRQERFAMISVFENLADYCPALKDVVRTKGKPVRILRSDLTEFLMEAVPSLTLLGMRVLLPKSMRNLLKPSLTAGMNLKGGVQSVLTRDALSDFSWEISIGGNAITKEDFERLLEMSGEVIQWKDDFVYLDPDVLKNIQEKLSGKKKPSYLERLSAMLTGEYQGIAVRASDELLKEVKRLNEVRKVPLPEGLRAALRPYQERGYSWLVKNIRLGLGALIADDMGLGKTLQVIAALLMLKEAGEFEKGKALVVLPTTLITNWEREIAKFAPSLSFSVYHGTQRSIEPFDSRSDVLLTTYGMLRRDYDVLAAEDWRILVLDEAQAVKNSQTGVTKAVRAFPVDQVIAMSGTPVENRLMEYWSLLSVVQPGLLGTEEDFHKTFARPIECDHDPAALDAFRMLTAPFMLRRLKTDRSIIADLPEKLVSNRYVELTPAQAALYQRVLNTHLSKLSEKEARQDKAGRNTQILSLITALKQICNSPSQYEKTYERMPDSGKGTALLELLEQCRNERRKVLVFTQYREMGERLQEWIGSAFGRRPDFLHGAVPLKQRSAMVDTFQQDPSVDVLIVSLKAGGTGLNLTAASVVVHYDLWWNPAVENQATDRAYRIGQERDVLVYRMLCAGTFEEKINEMLEKKTELSNMAVVNGEGWIGSLSTDQLKAIFSLE